MSKQENYEDKVEDLIAELTAVIAEHTDEIVVDEEYIVQFIRSLAEDALQQYLGVPEGEEGEQGIIEYYPDMDKFFKDDEFDDEAE